ncbi:MAG: peptide chain release factor 1 [Candidatus Babeliales bacterium]
MAIAWDSLQKRYDELSNLLSNPDLESNKRISFQKEFSHLSSVLEKHHEISDVEQKIAQAQKDTTQVSDPELSQMFADEINELQLQLIKRKQELDDILFPADERNDRSVYLEIRAGAGGQEAALFVADLQKMYTLYAQKMNWRVSVESVSPTDLGGYREIVLHIQGKGVYGHLRYESGVHRVQRVPATETQGRVHTSTVTVAVLPEAEEVDVTINPADLRIDVYRSSGAGGQHVNTTDSAVRITHIPSGVVVACQEERSQHKNKAKAMKLLQSRLLAAQMEKAEEQMRKQRKEQVGTGERAEKVRTYNFPQNRVTDHQVDLTLKKLDMVMEGDLDEIIDALMAKEREERKKNPALINQI